MRNNMKRATDKETREAILGFLGVDDEDLSKHRENGCSYMTPDGPDDNVKECDCPEEE